MDKDEKNVFFPFWKKKKLCLRQMYDSKTISFKFKLFICLPVEFNMR